MSIQDDIFDVRDALDKAGEGNAAFERIVDYLNLLESAYEDYKDLRQVMLGLGKHLKRSLEE